MKLLVATNRTQGDRDNDFSGATPGELVFLGFVCGIDEVDPDNGCGCGRAFTGLNSKSATTTAEIADLPLTREDVHMAVRAFLADITPDDPELEDDADEITDEVIQIAEMFDVADVVGRRVDDVMLRPYS